MALTPWPALERQLSQDTQLNAGVSMMMERVKEFPSPLTAMLAGIGVYEPSTQHFNTFLDSMWDKNTISDRTVYPEVVIGAGLHAAIYCAVRVANGFPPPLVLEAQDRVGGAFACSRTPAFYLNSRNRPGPLSVPGRSGGLNVLPGAPIQTADLSGGDYPTNSELAFVIRATLALYARVVTNTDIAQILPQSYGGQWRLFAAGKNPLTVRTAIKTKRLIIATGLGEATKVANAQWSERVLSYSQFMASLDGPFPFEGAKRWAVIGAGDSGRTAVEALIGQGPTSHWSVASVDAPQSIDWYGCKEKNITQWENCNRRRYRDIGRAFATEDGGVLRAFPKMAQTISEEYDSVNIDGRPYDRIIVCAGNQSKRIPGLPLQELRVLANNSGRVVATTAGNVRPGGSIFWIGPVTGLGYEVEEVSNKTVNPKNTEGTTALYRFASRTATLASMLDTGKIVTLEKKA